MATPWGTNIKGGDNCSREGGGGGTNGKERVGKLHVCEKGKK